TQALADRHPAPQKPTGSNMTTPFSPPRVCGRALTFCFACSWVVAGLTVGSSFAQQADRHQRREPGLVLDTGARRGNCDALTFTPDGQYLLAAGDDKVVHVWPFDKGKLGRDEPLRWPIWREHRGADYALAMGDGPKPRAV